MLKKHYDDAVVSLTSTAARQCRVRALSPDEEIT